MDGPHRNRRLSATLLHSSSHRSEKARKRTWPRGGLLDYPVVSVGGY